MWRGCDACFRCWGLPKRGTSEQTQEGFDTGVGHQIRKQPGPEARFRTDKKKKEKKAQKHNGLKN